MIYLRYIQVEKDIKEFSVWKCAEQICLNFTLSDIIIVLSRMSFPNLLFFFKDKVWEGWSL